MGYEEIENAIERAWNEFYHSLSFSGFTDEQINKLDRVLNMKDCFNDVTDCVMESVR